MTLVSGTIPNLVGGVSQQPPALRLASQCEEQVNALSSVASGVSKRPPAHHRAKLSGTPLDGAFLHTINRDLSERYNVVIYGGELKVYRQNGTQVPCAFPGGTDYLASADPATDFRAVSVVDYTFIINRSQVASIDPTPIVARPFEALIWVRQGAYYSKYSVTIAGLTAEYTTQPAAVPSNAESVQTSFIAQNLASQLNSLLGPLGFTVALFGSTIYVALARDFSVAYSDPLGDNAFKVIKGTVQNFSDLPVRGVNGMVVKVNGSNETAFDDYYVVYQADPGNANGGIWKECAKPGESYRFATTSLPRVLIRLPDGTFSFQIPPWAERAAGSLETVPFPSFATNTISDVFFHRNRLGFLAGENVVLSRSGDFFNFFRKTALQVLDTDPVDVAVATGGGDATLRHAVSYNEGLLLFSDQAQFQFGKADLLTPKTASVTLTTQFGCSRKVKPVGAGRNVYFAVTRGEYSSVREYYVDVDSRANDAADITAHVPRYIPKDVRVLAASTNEDIIVAVSSADPSSVYVYRYYWQGSSKLQSSWSRWDLGPTAHVLSCDFIESSLWLVVSRPDGASLEEIHLEPGRADDGLTFEYRLDRRITPALSYNAAENRTEFDLPYNPDVPGDYRCVATGTAGGTYRAGQAVPFTLLSLGATARHSVPGRLTGAVFGRSYASRYSLSPVFMRVDAGGGGQLPVLDGRLQMRRMTLAHSLTGYYRVEVTPRARATYTYVFAGRTLGSVTAPLGGMSLETGNFSFSIASKNDEVDVVIINDSHMPSTHLTASWEAYYTTRSQRV